MTTALYPELGNRLLKRHHSVVLWSRGCQVSCKYGAVASASISRRGHGRLLCTWDLVPNGLLSVSRTASWSRTPDAVCVQNAVGSPGRSEPIFVSVPR